MMTSSNAKYTGPKTVILRHQPGGEAVVEEILGLPYGSPKVGTLVKTKHGLAVCSGNTTSGSGPDAAVREVCFTLKA